MDNFQEQRFKHLFKIKNLSSDDDSILLYKVLSLDTNTCDEKTELTYSDFKQYLYVDNIPSIEANLERLKSNLKKGEKYHYIHSYGKNGKTTFNKRFIEENRETFQCIFIDFKDFQINRLGQNHSLITKIITFFNLLGSLFGDELVEVVVECLLHIQNTQMEIEIDSPNNELRNDYNSLFISIRAEFLSFIENIKSESKKQNIVIKQRTQKLFNEKFELFVGELLQNSQVKTIDLFDLLLLVTVKLYSKANKQIVMIFDNIDDVLTHSSEYLSAYIIPQVDIFFSILNKYINLKSHFIDEKILDGTSFIFTYRTANYVSSIYTINYNLSSSSRKDSLLSAPVYVLSSVGATLQILKKKLLFYNDLCNEFDIKISPKYGLLKSTLEAIEKDDNEFKHIFKLWNGNQFASIDCFKAFGESKMHGSLISDYTPKDANIIVNLKRGAFVFFIVQHYLNNTDFRVMKETTLSSALHYVFTDELGNESTGSCNLLRLFLSFIINHNQKLNREKEYVDNKDIFNKGVSFKKILDKLTGIKENGVSVYNYEMFKEMFERIFYDDIDAYDYFITCVKNTAINGETTKSFGKKYDFTQELEIYFNNKPLSQEQVNRLNSIRFYYNTNAKYFLNDLKKHFEFFSCTLKQEHYPLSYNIRIFQSVAEKELFEDFDYTFTYNFNNDKIIKSVYERVKLTIERITSFYLRVVIKLYPPTKYCQDSNFALNGVFHYDDLISKHITYIEKIRQGLMNGIIIYEFQNNLKLDYLKSDKNEVDPIIRANINGRFVYWIEHYIKLFNWVYELIKNEAELNNNDMDQHSKATRASFRILTKKINIIKNSTFLDITTKIETTDEKYSK